MSIQQAQLAESQGPLFPSIRGLAGQHVESVLANEAVQVPSIKGWSFPTLNLIFSEHFDVMWGGAATVLNPISQGVSNASVLKLIVEGTLEKAIFGATENLIWTPEFPGEMLVSGVGSFVPRNNITFLREDDPQLIFDFANLEILPQAAERDAAESPVNTSESVEMSWLVQNAEELGQYKGQWLLIQGQQLVAHSHDFGPIREAVREMRIRAPFVYYVPTDQESNIVSI